MSAWIRQLYKMPMWPRRNCRQVTALVLRQQDAALAWHERLAVRLHMQVCRACPRFAQQLRFMDQALGRWRRYRDEP